MNDIIIRTNEIPTFNNKKLNTASKKIAKIGTTVRKNLFELGAVLSEVNENELYIDDGFKNVAEYAEKTFGIKKSTTYNLVRIGSEFTAPELESNLPHDEGNDFTTTQIVKIFPIKEHNKIVELVEAEKITPDMSCKEIEKAVKEALNEGKEANGEGEGENDNEAVETKSEKIKITFNDDGDAIAFIKSIAPLFDYLYSPEIDKNEIYNEVLEAFKAIAK